jgi:hypothetical protein
MTATNSPLPWIKLHTKLVHHLQLPSVPIGERGVLLYLFMLAGLSSRRGTVLGDDRSIARIVGASRALTTRAIDRMSGEPFHMLRRIDEGVEVVNWNRYQTAKGSDPDYRRQLRQERERQDVNGQSVEGMSGESESESESEQESESDEALDGHDERLEPLTTVLASSRHASVFAGKRRELRRLLARHTDKDAVRAAEQFVRKVEGVRVPDSAVRLLESFVAKSGPYELRERELTAAERRARLEAVQ